SGSEHERGRGNRDGHARTAEAPPRRRRLEPSAGERAAKRALHLVVAGEWNLGPILLQLQLVIAQRIAFRSSTARALTGVCPPAVNRFPSCVRVRCRRDFTVPIGSDNTSATSASDKPAHARSSRRSRSW